MKTININLYKFNELSEEARKKVLNDHYDINVDYEWWESVYEDAANIGLIITSFDIDRDNYLDAHFKTSAAECAEEIRQNHGTHCDTFVSANVFLGDLGRLTGQYPNIEDCPEEEIESIEDDFLTNIQRDYFKLLGKHFEYLITEEAIIEAIEANDYYFTAEGKIHNL